MNMSASQTASERTATQPFQAIMITLSAALLVLFGVVIGRFVVTTQAVEVVDQFDADLTTLRAEIANLNRQLVKADSQAELARQSAEHFRQLATEQQIRADKMATRQLMIRQSVTSALQGRQRCLDELRQHVALDRSLPAGEVLRFAEDMYSAYTGTLQQLGGHSDVPTEQTPVLPHLSVSSDVPDDIQAASVTTGQPVRRPDSTNANESAQSSPRLPAPRIATSPVSARSRQSGENVDFAPPQPRARRSEYISFSARRCEQMVTLPASSGITFLDTAEADEPTARR